MVLFLHQGPEKDQNQNKSHEFLQNNVIIHEWNEDSSFK